MSGRDNLMDFFNLKKEFRRVQLQAPRTSRVSPDPLSVPPPASADSQPSMTEAEWRHYQADINRQLLEDSAASSHGSLFDPRSVVRSGMSGIEGSTLMGSRGGRSIVPHGTREDDRDLAQCFDFTKRAEDAWRLPVAEAKEELLEKVEENQVVVVSGPTGCGKSTQVPQFILDKHAREKKRVNILVTQPRKIAASSLAKRVCKERGWELGGLVGYQVGLDKAHKTPDTRLLYVTTGILKRMLIAKKHMNEWTHIILDEVHEREEDMDLVMLICKKLLLTNSRGTKLILMSATLDDFKFRSYFSLDPGLQPLPAPLVIVPQGKAAPVQEYHWDKLAPLLKDRYPATQVDPAAFDQGNPCMSESAIKMCKVLIEKLDSLEEQELARVVEPRKKRRLPGAVLVFLPGLGEIKQVRDFLMAEEGGERRSGPEWRCVPLHSSIPWDEHESIFDILPANQRKIILSTNIAESSLTVPDIRYVIDFCLTKNMVADPDTNYPRLVLDWASRSQMIQRKGRAGRVHHDGRVYRLIPLGLFNSLPQDHKPEMQRVPLTKVLLDVKMLEMGSPKDLLALAMDPPRMRNIQRTVLDLKDLGALLTTVRGRQCRDDGDLTVLGEIVARLPVDVKLGKLIVFGHIFNVLEEAIIIASGLNGKSIFTSPFDKRVQAYKNKLHWADRTFSDCFAILLAYQTWDGHRRKGTFSGRDGVGEREAVWCKESFLQRKQLLEMAEQVKEITRNLAMMDIEPLQIQDPVCWEPEYKFTILRLVMFGAFYPNYFVKSTGSEVEARAHRTLLGRDPKNTVYLHGFDQDQAEFGELYAEQVKRIFRAATTDEEQIRVTFDKAHVFVEFNRSAGEQEKSMSSYSSGQADRNVTGDISSQVYVAVKLRQQSGGEMGRNKPAVKMYNYEVAVKKFAEWKLAIEQSAGAEVSSSLVEQVAPPDMAATELVLEPVHVSSPSVFWVQHGERAAEQADRLQEILATCCLQGGLQRVRGGRAGRGELFIAPYCDEGEEQPCFYRARVNTVQGSKVTVFFIDYGNMATLEVQDLLVISPKLIQEHPDIVKIPGLALECRLARLQPSRIRNSRGLWDREAVSRFQDLLDQGLAEGRLVGRIFSVTQSGSGHSKAVVALESISLRSHGLEDREVRQTLLQEHLAEAVTSDGYISEQAHQERQNYRAYAEAMKKHMDNYQKYSSMAISLRPGNSEVNKQTVRVTLNGPFSPLEHKVSCLHRHGSTKMANVDLESVNSVLLNQSPGDSYDHYMVAAHVGMNPSGETLQLRNTTWLPARPGLGALATMVFSPQVEMRTNPSRSRITGCVSGLGPRTDWDRPDEEVTRVMRTEGFYPEHDIETRFDVSITNNDINSVNKIRYWLSQMLSKSGPLMRLTQPVSLDKAQKGIRSSLEELFTRERHLEQKEPLPAGQDYRWNLLKKQHRKETSVTEQDQYIYKSIDGVRVTSGDSSATMSLLLDLWKKADPGNTRLLQTPETCPACPGQGPLASLHEVFTHLHTPQHKEVEQQMIKGDEASRR